MSIIVTFEEKLRVGREDEWVKSSRIYEDLDEVKDFVEFLYEGNTYNTIRDIHVWHASEITHGVKIDVWFEEMETEE